MAVQQQSEVWGWQQFFDELSAFLHELERQEVRANQQFAEYALEHLEAVVVNVTAIKNVLSSSMALSKRGRSVWNMSLE